MRLVSAFHPCFPTDLERPILSHRVEQLRISVITTILCCAYPVSVQAWEPLRRRRSKVTCECSCGGAPNKAKGRLVQNGLHIPPAQAECAGSWMTAEGAPGFHPSRAESCPSWWTRWAGRLGPNIRGWTLPPAPGGSLTNTIPCGSIASIFPRNSSKHWYVMILPPENVFKPQYYEYIKESQNIDFIKVKSYLQSLSVEIKIVKSYIYKQFFIMCYKNRNRKSIWLKDLFMTLYALSQELQKSMK